MARVNVTHSIGDLASDLVRIQSKAPAKFAKVVRDNAKAGNKLAQQYANQRRGPHGIHYWKRLSAEQTGPLSWEYGPTGTPKSNFVGVGFRSGVNLDLPHSADVIGPKLAKDVGDVLDGLFW